jgi:hypothetical protein
MYSFPVEVVITSFRELTELQPVNRSPKKMRENLHINLMILDLISGTTAFFINLELYFFNCLISAI